MSAFERLTTKSYIVDGYILKCMCTFGRDGEADDESGCPELCLECGADCNKCGVQTAFNRLAEYENTGLSPQEIQELKERSSGKRTMDINIKFELRPCMVNGQKALFHAWTQHAEIVPPSPMIGGHSGGQISQMLGIIEREDGTIHKCYADEIRFLDSGNAFYEYDLYFNSEEERSGVNA